MDISTIPFLYNAVNK